MSWDACLQAADGGYVTPEWNFTHNTNGMIAAAYEAVTGNTTPQCGGPLGRAIGPAWWERLDGQPGGEGAEYLAVIVTGLESDPARYRAMNPENGWGSYDTLLPLLREMRDAPGAIGTPAVWQVSG